MQKHLHVLLDAKFKTTTKIKTKIKNKNKYKNKNKTVLTESGD